MQSPGNQNQENSGINWLAVVRILLVQVLVLLALSGVIIGYLEWSSDAAWAEFIASTPWASDTGGPSFRAPVHAVRNPAFCIRSA
jgi:hypothetical protein